MPLFTTLSALSQTAASNPPDGTVDAPSTIDDQLRLLGSFIAILRDGAGFTTPIPFLTAALGSDGTLSFRNRLRNGNFAVNQRAVAGTVTLAAGAYGHDGWKAGASGCTYTFAASGNSTVLTISAGSLLQPIEGAWVEGGVYALANRGTAQARIAVSGAATSGAYAAATASAPLLSASATANQQMAVEFATGTLDRVQLEPGSAATTFERRLAGVEVALCLRYYQAGQNRWDGYMTAGTQVSAPVWFRAYMRGTPAVGVTNQTTAGVAPATVTVTNQDSNGFWEVRQSATSGAATFTSSWAASAEL